MQIKNTVFVVRSALAGFPPAPVKTQSFFLLHFLVAVNLIP